MVTALSLSKVPQSLDELTLISAQRSSFGVISLYFVAGKGRQYVPLIARSTATASRPLDDRDSDIA